MLRLRCEFDSRLGHCCGVGQRTYLSSALTAMIGQAIWSEFFANKDWPTAAAVAVVLVCVLVTPIVVFQHQAMRGMERD